MPLAAAPPVMVVLSPGRELPPFPVGFAAEAPPGTPGRFPSGEMERFAERLPAGTLTSGETGAGLAERAIKRRVSDSLPVIVVPRSGAAPASASDWRAGFDLGAAAEPEGIFTSRGGRLLPVAAPDSGPLFLISGGAPASEFRAEFNFGAAAELPGILTSGGRFELPAKFPLAGAFCLMSGAAPASELRAEFAFGAAVELVGIFTSGG